MRGVCCVLLSVRCVVFVDGCCFVLLDVVVCCLLLCVVICCLFYGVVRCLLWVVC